jgi:hypothetical protein
VRSRRIGANACRIAWPSGAAPGTSRSCGLGTRSSTTEAASAGADEAAIEKISDRAHLFLDENEALIHLEPLDQFRFGFVDRLRKLGFESTKAALYSLALRYFSYIPTIEDIRNDVNLSVARQPIGGGVPSQFKAILDQLAAEAQRQDMGYGDGP